MVAALLLALGLTGSAPAQYVSIDGDTIIVIETQERIRIVGLDTPEIRHARCTGELEKGFEAQRRLQRLLNEGRVELERSRRRDKYGRTLAVVRVDGEDVAEILVREELAVPYNGRTKRIDWCTLLSRD
jgi:micrococcal nuclease